MIVRFLIGLLGLLLVGCEAPRAWELGASDSQLRSVYGKPMRLGDFRLYGIRIRSFTDDQGRRGLRASGGAVLVRDGEPVLRALADGIELGEDSAMLRERGVVLKDQNLWVLRDSPRAEVRIEGGEVLPRGPVSRLKAGPQVEAPNGATGSSAERGSESSEVKRSRDRSQTGQEKPKTPRSPGSIKGKASTPSAAAKTSPQPSPQGLERKRALQLLRVPEE